MDKAIDSIEDCRLAVSRLKQTILLGVDAEWSGLPPNTQLCLLQVSFYLDPEFTEKKKRTVYEELQLEKETNHLETIYGAPTTSSSELMGSKKHKRRIGVYLFDCLIGGMEMMEKGGLKEVLESNSIVKVFHDCRQDSQVLNNYGIELRNVMDT